MAKKRVSLEVCFDSKIFKKNIYIPDEFLNIIEDLSSKRFIEVNGEQARTLAKYLKPLNKFVKIYFARDAKKRKSFVIIEGKINFLNNRILINP